MNLRPQFIERPRAEDLRRISDGLDDHNRAMTGADTGNKDLFFVVRDEHETMIGGVHGTCNSSGWLYIVGLWVDALFRGNGCGGALLTSIENAAMERGCRHAYLHTLAFQAPAFYERRGYRIFATLEAFHRGHDKYFLLKHLT